MKTLLLIDGNSILNRAFYGIRPLTTSSGLFTHAVYGMMNIVLKHIEARKPDYAAVAFDLKAPTFRHLKYDGYKATRKGMPEELAVQLPYAKKCMTALGLNELELAGYEADDILGTCAAFGNSDSELQVYILTGDRDSFQLIRDNVTVLLASTGDTIEFHREQFKEKYEVEPEQFVDVKALMGDSSDNIPGVAGIGEKTAVKLIFNFGSLEGVYDNLNSDKIAASAAKKLEAGKESAYLSRFLAQIKCDVPLGINLSELSYNGYDKKLLKELLTELELFSLAKRLGVDKNGTEESGDALNNESTKPDDDTETLKVTLDELFKLDFDICSAVISENKIEIFDGEKIYFAEYSEKSEISPFFSAKERKVIVADSKKLCFDFGKPKCEIFDVTLAAYVIDTSENSYDVPRLSLKYLGQMLSENFKISKVLYDLAPVLETKLKESGQEDLYKKIEEPLAYVLADMEK